MRSDVRVGLLFALALCSPAAQAVGRVGLSAGMETSVDDPFLATAGPRVSLEYNFSREVVLGLSAALYPDLGQTNWRRHTRFLIEELNVSPDISAARSRLGPYLQVAPVRSELPGGLTSSVLLVGGLGLVHTIDDLEALQTDESDSQAVTTMSQNHLEGLIGIGAAVGSQKVSVRGRVTNHSYLEVVNSDTLEKRSQVLLGLEVLWRP